MTDQQLWSLIFFAIVVMVLMFGMQRSMTRPTERGAGGEDGVFLGSDGGSDGGGGDGGGD